MKKHTTLALVSLTMLLNQGCIFPTDFWSSSYPSDYSTYNTDKFISERNYEKEMPFRMRDEAINVPLVSNEGQVNINVNLIHGIGSNATVAINDKMFFEGGLNYTSSENIEYKSAQFNSILNSYNYYSNMYEQFNGLAYKEYSVTSSIDNASFSLGAGFYKKFKDHGRFTYHAGFSNGTANTNYTFSVPANNIGSDQSYAFEEHRKFYQCYLQSDFGYVTHKTEGAIIARAFWMHFTKQDFEMGRQIPAYEMNSNQFVLQPGFHFAYGKKFRVFTQCGWNIPLGDSQIKWFSTNVQFGMVFRISENQL